MKKVVFCGGGTAGHVYPALAVAEKLENCQIHFFGGSGMEKDILKNFPNITYHQIPVVKFERKLTPKNLLIPIKLFKGIKAAKAELKKINPDVVFSKGGFVSVPVALAAKKLGIRVVSHESDLSFGLANKIILHSCTYMCTTFKETATKNKKCIHTGQPIRQKIFNGKKLNLGFNSSRPTILVLGGSLGAKFLNDLVFNHLDTLLKKYNVIHICGKNNYRDIKKDNYLLLPFAENIEDYFATADIVVSRAGSGVINELLALSKPMLLVPLSKKCSRGDQIENARLFEKYGYCQMVEEEQCTFFNFLQKLENLQKNASKMQENMKKTAKNNSVSQIVEILKKCSDQ